MGDTMSPTPIEGTGTNGYFWFDPPTEHILPNGTPSLERPYNPGMSEFHPSLDYHAHLESKVSLTVFLPFGGLSTFDLPRFPADRWEKLVDDAGNQIPLRIYVHGGRVAGQWLADPGIVPPPPATARHAEPSRSGKPTPDRSFGEKGAVLASWLDEPCDAQAMCVQPDGRLIVAGGRGPADSDSGRGMALARFLPDGRLDRHYGVEGWAPINTGLGAVAHAVARQDDGKIVLAGEMLGVVKNHRREFDDPILFERGFVLRRYTIRGDADWLFGEFGEGGQVLTDFGGESQANAVAIQEDGKIVAAGWCARPSALQSAKPGRRSKSQANSAARTACFALARYNEDGSLDDSFGEGGLATTQFAEGAAYVYALAIQPTGELVAAGVVRSDPAKGSSDFACARYRTDGSLDQSFGTGGRATVAVTAAEDTARAIALQDDGKIVLAGTAADRAAHESHFALRRLDAHGQPDTSFNGKRAVVTGDFPGGASGVAIQADGAILAAGYATVRERDEFAIARYRHDGSPDPTFGAGGAMYLSLGGLIDRAHAIAVDSKERILLAGTSRRSKTQVEFALARVLPGAH